MKKRLQEIFYLHIFHTLNLTEALSVPSLKAYQSHAHWFYSNKSIFFILRKEEAWPCKRNKQTNKRHSNINSNKLPHYYAFMEDTIRQNVGHMTSKSKACTPFLLVIIIKWCHMITWDTDTVVTNDILKNWGH